MIQLTNKHQYTFDFGGKVYKIHVHTYSTLNNDISFLFFLFFYFIKMKCFLLKKGCMKLC